MTSNANYYGRQNYLIRNSTIDYGMHLKNAFNHEEIPMPEISD